MSEEKPEENYFFPMLVGLIIVVALLLALAFFNAEKQHYSLLYFSSRGLPFEATVSTKVPVSFFIENQEGFAANYDYSVLVNGVEKSKATVSLQRGEKRLFEESIVFSSAETGSQKVSVQAQNKETRNNYEIFFWVKVS